MAKAMIYCALYPREMLGRSWNVLEPFVREALKHSQGETDTMGLLKKASIDKVQVWVVVQTDTKTVLGVATTEVVDYDNVAALRVITLGGVGMAQWMEQLCEKLTAFARLHHCDRIESVGRPGFARRLLSLGFQPSYVVMTLQLTDRVCPTYPIRFEGAFRDV